MNKIKKDIINVLSVTPSAVDGTFEAEFTLPADFIGFRGHFPARPIMPGVAIICAITAAGEAALGASLTINEIKNARFFSPVAPDMKVKMKINLDPVKTGYLIKAKLVSDEKTISRASILTSVAP